MANSFGNKKGKLISLPERTVSIWCENPFTPEEILNLLEMGGEEVQIKAVTEEDSYSKSLDVGA